MIRTTRLRFGAGRWAVLGVALALGWAPTAHAACPLPSEPLPALAAVVRLLEPALPRTVAVGRIEVEPDHPYHADLRYLRERGVLPGGVVAEPLGAAGWQAALDVIAGWYAVQRVAGGDPGDPAAVAADLEALLASVRRAVRPVALIAWQPEDRSRLAFLAQVWNWSAYPRLIVWRLDPDDSAVDTGLAGMARRLDTCAYPVTAYVAASAPVARGLFLEEDRGRMFVVGSEPELPGFWPREVPSGDEIDVFAFTHPWVASLDAYSVVFVGDAAPILTLMRLLPQVRSNLSPIGAARMLAVPAR